MSLINRETTPAQVMANRANSLHSTGPRSTRGKASASRNAQKPDTLPSLLALSLEALGEDPADFERRLNALLEAMRPRDAWEAAWVQDIAMLRWRLARLHWAESGTLAMRRRHGRTQRQRAALPPTGVAGIEVTTTVSTVGFAGVADSAMKFQQVLEFLKQLRDVVRAETFEKDTGALIAMIYGRSASPQGILLQVQFQNISKAYKDGRGEATMEERKSLLDDLNQEIKNYEQLLAAYWAEHLADDLVHQAAELLLPTEELDQIIRYEAHLENQIERKLRQFYARRRESRVVEADAAPAVPNEEDNSDPACQAAQA